jgi:hypothetical protein
VIAFVTEIAAAAAAHGLQANVLAAQVEHESGFDPWAWNPEPRYKYLVDCRTGAPFRHLTALELLSEDPPPDFPRLAGDRDQEWWGQQASWGLLQVMGALAREVGFRRPYLSQLCDPAISLELGARHLAALFARFGTIDRALAAYNAGSPTSTALAAYAAPILERAAQIA